MVALGQRDDQAEVGLEEVVLGAVAVAADPAHVASLSRRQLLALVSEVLHDLHGVEAGLDALGQFDFLFGVEECDLADLLEVGANRVGGRRQFGILACLAESLGLFLVPDEVAGSLVLLGRLCSGLFVFADCYDLDDIGLDLGKVAVRDVDVFQLDIAVFGVRIAGLLGAGLS